MWNIYIIQTETNNYYVGLTKNLDRRLYEHQAKFGADFTKRFDQQKLVYQEIFHSRLEAENREKQLKGWSKAKKKALINQDFLLLEKLSKNSETDEG